MVLVLTVSMTPPLRTTSLRFRLLYLRGKLGESHCVTQCREFSVNERCTSIVGDC